MQPEVFNEILYAKDDTTGIVTVTLNTPKRKNALSSLTFLELFWAVASMEKDDSATAMIITGAKDPDSDDPKKEAFSSGGYFNPSTGPLGQNDDTLSHEAREQIDFTDIAQKKLTLKMWQFDKPVIAAINGFAIGAGFTMPLACADLIIASEHAWALLPFVRLGILPEFSSTFLLPRLLGYQKAKEIMYLGKTLPAQQLLELGLVNQVVPHDELMDAAKKLALQLIPPQGPGLAVKMTKRALHQPLIADLEKALDLENKGLNKAFTSEDFVEGMTARFERRAPVYKGQ
jgi:2-(1,2-epoxy-1,2-dihydrophenyl)acetyl-CoA isomerase